MTRQLILLAACVAALTGCAPDRLSSEWKVADLDRNWLNLAIYRGVEDATDLAEGMSEPENVVSAVGTVRRGVPADDTEEPLEIVLLYPGAEGSGFAADTEDVCYEFTVPDGYETEFHRVDCPD
ncbi:hypothetical protein AFL01nite_04660 [Aeromicrobium flavum]|uniref:Lipoprotein n=1 Tax=Aeromicrobium flavum TaxID=416568 RepID=A0A512HRR0_9ACTN|nr:hypothetical protein [Aeromicrobium flavum]GEO88139.1 hypothetical protein AFL01nite_04660 [Aeromicrobium flavum]